MKITKCLDDSKFEFNAAGHRMGEESYHPIDGIECPWCELERLQEEIKVLKKMKWRRSY